MGDILMCNCTCGYGREVFLGAGMNAINKQIINRVFGANTLKKFNKADKDFELGTYMMSNVLCECKVCKELTYAPKLNYSINGVPQREILGKCEKCFGELEILESDEAVPCPKCGQLIEGNRIGFWD